MNTSETLKQTCREYARDMWNAYADGRLYEWLDENVLCVEALIVDTFDRYYVMGCVISLALGGPTIRVNTFDSEVAGHWYPDTCTISINDKLADAITEYYAQMC